MRDFVQWILGKGLEHSGRRMCHHRPGWLALRTTSLPDTSIDESRRDSSMRRRFSQLEFMAR